MAVVELASMLPMLLHTAFREASLTAFTDGCYIFFSFLSAALFYSFSLVYTPLALRS